MKKHRKLTLLHLFTFEHVHRCNGRMLQSSFGWNVSVLGRYLRVGCVSNHAKVHNIFIKVSYSASLSVNKVYMGCAISLLRFAVNAAFFRLRSVRERRKLTDGNIMLAFIVVNVFLIKEKMRPLSIQDQLRAFASCYRTKRIDKNWGNNNKKWKCYRKLIKACIFKPSCRETRLLTKRVECLTNSIDK